MTHAHLKNGMRGFACLRTRPNTPVTVPLPPKRYCTRCGAVLRSSNQSETCMPCAAGEIDIPDWALSLVAADSRPSTVISIAAALLGKPEKDLLPEESRRTICETYAAGGVSQEQLGRRYGLGRATVQWIIGRGVLVPEKGRAAGEGGPDTKSKDSLVRGT